jgi:tetratricopeptide (TPR) repeat protein
LGSRRCRRLAGEAPAESHRPCTVGKFSNGKFEEALEMFRRVIAIKPGFYVVHSDLKRTYAALGRTTEAEPVSQQMLEMMPNYLLQNSDDSRARMFYAITLLETGHKERGVAAKARRH